MKIYEALSNNQHWLKNRLNTDNQYFKKLNQGQNPEILFIGCSDSRVPIETIIGAKPGDIFVHRNIGNLVPINDLNATSVIEYAVTQLKVKHLVICGHTGCGGIKAGLSNDDLGILNPWISNIKVVYEKYKHRLVKIENKNEKVDKLVEYNVLEQCNNTLNIPSIRHAINNKTIKIHAWIYNMSAGNIIDLKFDN